MGMTLPVKWYDSSMGGCPSPGNNATAGGLAAYFDAVLVDGFNTVTLDSVVVASNVATATRSAGNHGFVPHQVIEIAGATPSALNGQWRVISVTAQTFTFATTGISDQTASGTITCKTPALGWIKEFSSGSKRVYRSSNTDECARSYFRFDDSVADVYGARLQAYASMTDIDNGVYQWVEEHQSVPRNKNSTSPHFACGDDKTFYGVWSGLSDPWLVRTLSFGAFESYLPNDVDNDYYGGTTSTTYAYSYGLGNSIFSTLRYASYWLDHNMRVRRRSLRDTYSRALPARWVNDISGYGGPPYPEPFTNGLFVTPNLLRENDHAGLPVRGRVRGTYWVLQNLPMVCPLPGIDLDDVIGLAGRRCRLIDIHSSDGSSSSVAARALFDITGPWD